MVSSFGSSIRHSVSSLWTLTYGLSRQCVARESRRSVAHSFAAAFPPSRACRPHADVKCCTLILLSFSSAYMHSSIQFNSSCCTHAFFPVSPLSSCSFSGVSPLSRVMAIAAAFHACGPRIFTFLSLSRGAAPLTHPLGASPHRLLIRARLIPQTGTDRLLSHLLLFLSVCISLVAG